ncbi:universal stress protein [Citricoccus zhacaiensis]
MSVVVNYSATAESEAALAMAEEESARRGVDVHVVVEGGADTTSVHRRAQENATSWHVHEVPEHQSLTNATLDLAADLGADLIVIGTRRRSPVGKLFLGSAAQEILLAAEVPVLLVKP